jgi:hypothetical protein
MVPVPRSPDVNAEDDEVESEASIWGFLLALFLFKLVTVIVIFWQMQTWEAGLILGATFWYFFPPLILLASGPVYFYLRLRKVRARREALRRSEWMLDDDQPLPTLKQAKRS